MNFMDRAQCPDTARRPRFSLSGLHSHPVESGGNVGVRPPGSHGPHDGKGGLRGTLAMFTRFGFANTQLRVLATFPVDRQNDFALLVVYVSNDISHESAKELLTATHVDTRRAPGRRQIGSHVVKIGNWGGKIDLSHLGQSRFAGFHAPQRCLPTLLKLSSDQSVVRIASGIAAFRKRCLVSCLLQVQLHHLVPLFQIIPMSSFSFHCSLDRHWRHGAQYLSSNSRIDARGAKSHTSWLGQHLIDTFAAIIGMSRSAPRIDDAQSPSTSSAGEQSCKQRPTATPGLNSALLSESINGNKALVPLKLTPIDIAFMMVLEHHFPRSKRFAVGHVRQ